MQDSSQVLKWLAVIGAAIGNPEGHDLALMVNEQVELEAEEPAQGGAATLGQSSEDPVAADAPVVADRQLDAGGKVDAGLLASERMQQQTHKSTVAGENVRAVPCSCLRP